MFNELFANIILISMVVAFVIFVAILVVDFFRKPSEMQKKLLVEFLKGAVTEAEKLLGSGTGELKLTKVYGMAVQKFPWVATIYPYEKFKMDVNIALAWMEHQLETNENFRKYVRGE